MKILCGSDFTSAASVAADAALAIAARTGGTLRLVHVSDRDDEAAGVGDEALKTRLKAEAKRLAAAGGTAEIALLRGHPDEAIDAEARRLGADLIVVGALGRRERPRWRLGSTADRIAQHATCPVLVARAAEPFATWARGERPLRVAAAIDPGPPSEALLRALAKLLPSNTYTLVGAHVYWPPEARERLHLHGAIPIGKGNREVEAAIERELRERIATLADGTSMDLRIVGGLGRIADHIVQIAEDENVDLVAVGSHQRAGFERLWHGSISHGVIDGAPMSVLCVPSR
jgi:nucleotide-binding universal stress UspA family protein